MPEGEELVVERKTVNELRSMAFVSGAGGGYKAVPLPDGLQMLNLRDIVQATNGQGFYYLGSNEELVAVQANAMGTRLGVLGAYDPATESFVDEGWLKFPIGTNGRSIVPLENGKGLVVTNNGYPYLVELPN